MIGCLGVLVLRGLGWLVAALFSTRAGLSVLAAAVLGAGVYVAARVSVTMPLLVPVGMGAYALVATGLAMRALTPRLVVRARPVPDAPAGERPAAIDSGEATSSPAADIAPALAQPVEELPARPDESAVWVFDSPHAECDVVGGVGSDVGGAPALGAAGGVGEGSR